MLIRSTKQLLRQQYGTRYMATTQTVDLVEQMKTYPFLKKFMYDPEDPIKKKWEMIKDWSLQCQKNPEITDKQFKVLRQRYELTPLYDDNSLTENNPFLKDVFERIKDPDKYNKTNQYALSDAQFEVTKRIVNENIAVNHFLSKLPQLMIDSKKEIDKLPYRKLDYTRFETSVKAWGTYKFLSYGHPKMIQLYTKMVNNGDLSCDEIKDVVHYMKMQGNYAYSNPDFKEALKWFSRMNWMNEHEFGDDIYQKHITDYFDLIYRRYTVIKSILENEETLKGCQYMQDTELFKPEVKDIELWLQKLSKKETDPLITWLKQNLSGNASLSSFEEFQNAIINRFQLDIGGLFNKYSDILVALLQNQYYYKLKPNEIGRERERVLSGAKLDKEYLDELQILVQNVQALFLKEID